MESMRPTLLVGAVLFIALAILAPDARAACDPDMGQTTCNGGCCPKGTSCNTLDSTCIQDCPMGMQRCGVKNCIPNGNVCCDDRGHPEISCESTHHCTPEGTCQPNPPTHCSSTPGARGEGATSLVALMVGVCVALARRRRRPSGHPRPGWRDRQLSSR